ncbi:Uncharacterised protein [Bordetella ansorpii]|uniref:Fido domain-containing protein n=2 Tax=Bordetella ansorpii TaxID=288768 RepID=A0A157LBL7_9BORD|nr:Uncharacterised protein [Bordetella ansorpii]
MAWIHPFIDGNGRAVRLQTHAVMSEISQGLWSANRGLARDVGQYYAHLAAADIPRQGDLDGRGNLTERGLIDWVQYFLRICSDQVDFMSRMLDMDNMKTRIEALITFRSTQDPEIRREAVLPLYHLFAAGPLTRGEFSQMSGMGERTSRKLIARLLQTGLITSPSTHGLLRFALPLDALQFLLPGLYPEAAAPLD